MCDNSYLLLPVCVSVCVFETHVQYILYMKYKNHPHNGRVVDAFALQQGDQSFDLLSAPMEFA